MSSRNAVYTLAVTASVLFAGACSNDPATSVVGAEATSVTPPVAKTHRGFVWSIETGLEVIPLPPSATSMDVAAVNNAGQVVGYVTQGEGTENYRAFIWSSADGYKPLGSLVGPDGISLAFSISEAGEVRGLSEGPSTNLNGPMGISLGDFFSWTARSGMEAISKPRFSPDLNPVSEGGKLILPHGMSCSEVTGANEKGQAIGYAGWAGDNGCIFSVALLWNADGKPVQIAECGSQPWCGTTLRDINNGGAVVGYRERSGFRWTAPGGFAWIPMENAALHAINDNGDAAGAVGTGSVSTPVVWMASGEVRKIQLPAGAVYGYSVGIDQSGQVTGSFK